MSDGELDVEEAASPRRTDAFFGHAAPETALLAAYRGGRVPHAFDEVSCELQTVHATGTAQEVPLEGAAL